MYIVVYTKVQVNGDTHGEAMSDIGVKQGCSMSPILFGLHIDEFETYLDKIDRDYMWLFNIMVALLIFVDNVVRVFQ